MNQTIGKYADKIMEFSIKVPLGAQSDKITHEILHDTDYHLKDIVLLKDNTNVILTFFKQM